MAPRIETRNLTKRFAALTAVDAVSIEFAPGQIHAVLGENGAGKSTLMRLLFGLLSPTGGEILLDGAPVVFHSSTDAIARGLGMVQQHFTLVDTLSAIDNIMLGAEVCGKGGRLDRTAAIRRMESLLPSPHLAVPWHAKVGELSVGQKQRVEILKLLFRDAHVLVLDEPTAVLTPMEIEDFFSVLKQLRAGGRTVILITHKIGEVLRLCDTFAVLRGGRLITRGLVAESSVEQIVESMIGRRLPEFTVERPAARPERRLVVRHLREEGTARDRLRGIDLNVGAGEVVGIAGVEGSGQAALVDALMGLRAFSGEVEFLGERLSPFAVARVRALGMGLIPEDRLHQALWSEESCHTNMVIGLEKRFARGPVLQFAKIYEETSEWAKTFDVRASGLHAPVGSLSGGNQQKIVFAREVTGREPRFLICHQPTRGVDLGAIDLIHRRLLELRAQGLGILVLSSELEELTKLCDRIYVFFEGRITGEFARAHFDPREIGVAMTGAKHG